MANTEINASEAGKLWKKASGVDKGSKQISSFSNQIIGIFLWKKAYLKAELNKGLQEQKHKNKAFEMAFDDYFSQYKKPAYWDTAANQYDIRIEKQVFTIGWMPNGSEYNSPFAMNMRKAFLAKYEKHVANYPEYGQKIQELNEKWRGKLWADYLTNQPEGVMRNRMIFGEEMQLEGQRLTQLPYLKPFLFERPPGALTSMKKNSAGQLVPILIDKAGNEITTRGNVVKLDEFINILGMQFNALATRGIQDNLGYNDFVEEAAKVRLNFATSDIKSWGFKSTIEKQDLSEMYRWAIQGHNGSKDASGKVIRGYDLGLLGHGDPKIIDAAQKFSIANNEMLLQAFNTPENFSKILEDFYVDKAITSSSLKDKGVSSSESLGTKLQSLLLSSGETSTSKGYSRTFSFQLADHAHSFLNAELDKQVSRGEFIGKDKELKLARKRVDSICDSIMDACTQKNSQAAQYLESAMDPLTKGNEVIINYCAYGTRGHYGSAEELIIDAVHQWTLSIDPEGKRDYTACMTMSPDDKKAYLAAHPEFECYGKKSFRDMKSDKLTVLEALRVKGMPLEEASAICQRAIEFSDTETFKELQPALKDLRESLQRGGMQQDKTFYGDDNKFFKKNSIFGIGARKGPDERSIMGRRKK